MRVLIFLVLLLCSACAPSGGNRINLPSLDWHQLEERLISTGNMRLERSAEDASFDEADLVRNFERVVFHAEARSDENQVGNTAEALARKFIRRWERPVRIAVKGRDRIEVQRVRAALLELVPKLRDLTGREITVTQDGADADQMSEIVVLTGSGRDMLLIGAAFQHQFRKQTPPDAGDRTELSPAADFMARWLATPASPCAGMIITAPEGGARAFGQITLAFIVIRADLPPRFHRACVEEEVVQSFGPIGDDPSVRPSIFNDDQEFARMTDHDAAILKILYDPRLRSGMTPDEAMPIVRRIAARIAPAS